MVRRLRRRWTCLTARFRFSAKTRAAMRWKKPSSRRNRPFGRAVLDRAGSHGRIPSPRAPRARCKPDDGSKAPRPGAAGRLWRRRRPKPRNRIPGRRLRELQGPVTGDRQGRPEATRGARLKPPESGSGAAPRAPHMRPQVRLFLEPDPCAGERGFARLLAVPESWLRAERRKHQLACPGSGYPIGAGDLGEGRARSAKPQRPPCPLRCHPPCPASSSKTGRA